MQASECAHEGTVQRIHETEGWIMAYNTKKRPMGSECFPVLLGGATDDST